MSSIHPTFSYPLSSVPLDELDVRRGAVRRVAHAGRAGVLLDDVFGGIVLGPHNLAEPRGSVALWVMPMEDLHTWQRLDHHHLNVPDADEFTLLSDRETVKDSRAAHFALVWGSYWTPSFFVKRFAGHVYEAFRKPLKGVATAGHLALRKGAWYQVVYAWDTPANRHRVYVNGVLVAHHDHFAKEPLQVSDPGPFLCAGSSMIVTGDICGFAAELSGDDCTRLFRAEAASVDPEIQSSLERTYLGRNLPRLDVPSAGDGWRTDLELSLTDPAHLRRFHLQGWPAAPRITDEGLRITTAPGDPLHNFAVLDLSHVYLWSRDWFEGDLHLSYRFQNLKPGGLSLLMTQCSGMQREDFFKSHRPRTNGIMKPVCWEDIRNYHWEYLRQMDDVRNDVASHAMLKNPWHRALGFGVHGQPYAPSDWHELDFLQQGGRIRCAIDGDVVIDATDRADDNNGPVLSAGRFAIRCMTRTDIRVRDLKVRTRAQFGG